MPRGSYRIASGPFAIWTARVIEQNRIRLPLEIQGVVPWLSGQVGTVDCAGVLGPIGGVQLQPLAEYEKIHGSFIESLGENVPMLSDAGKPWVKIARLLATTWRIPLHIESTRVTITLPEPARRAVQLPDSGGVVVVFGFGEILEVWDAPRWHDHVREVAKDKSSLLSSGIDDLQDR